MCVALTNVEAHLMVRNALAKAGCPAKRRHVSGLTLQPQAAARQYHQNRTPNHAPPKPLCLARVVEVSPGCKGLVAAQHLQPGQPALVLAPYNTLAVPVGGSVHQWECDWLEPFERVHGPLPPALVDFLMDHMGPKLSVGVEVAGTCQLIALLLYARHLAATATAAGKRSFWADWLRMLPPFDQATTPFGTWSDEELQLLRFEPHRSSMKASNTTSKLVCKELLNSFQERMPTVHLADSVDDVMLALFHVQTRCIGIDGWLAVLPMHDFINHAEQPNCMTTNHDAHTPGWHVVLPTSPIAPGEELCINYSAEPLSNLDTLLAWGFTGRPSPLDPVLPMAYRALPALDAHLMASTAAQMLTECGPVLDRSRCADLEAQLLAVAGSLPLGGLTASAAGSVTGKDAGGDNVGVDDQYSEAAALFSYGEVMSLSPWLSLSCSDWQGTAGAAQQQGMGADSSSRQGWAGAGVDAGAKLAMQDNVSSYAAYVGGRSAQQQARLADIKEASKHAANSQKQQYDVACVAAAQQGSAGLRLQSQLQLLTVQACSAAAQLQLFFAQMTDAEGTQLHQLLSGRQAPLEQRLAQARVSQNLAPPCNHLWRNTLATPNGVSQPVVASAPAPVGQPQLALQQSAVGRWLQAQELQHTIVTELLMLQACLVLGAVSGSARSRVGPAAERLLVAVRPGLNPDVVSPMGRVQDNPRQQEMLMQELLHLQDVQLQHLRMCSNLTGGPAALTKLSITSNCRVGVACQVNKMHESLLRVCVTFLARLADGLRAGA